MTWRDHGYYGFAFVGTRPVMILALIPVIGMVGNFVAELSRAQQQTPSELIVALVMPCLALLWVLLSFTAYDDTHIPYFITSAVDICFTVPFIVISAVLGAPLSATTCSALPKQDPGNGSMLALPVNSQGKTTYVLFVGADQATCNEIMAVWGFLIVLCVTFAVSAIAAGFLFLGKRRAMRDDEPSEIEMAPKDFSDGGSLQDGGYRQ